MAERPDYPCPATGLPYCPDYCDTACLRLDGEPDEDTVIDCSALYRRHLKPAPKPDPQMTLDLGVA